MEGSTLSALIVRFFQLVFAATILGLSVKVYEDLNGERNYCDYFHQPCDFGQWFPGEGYAAFVGAFGLLDALIGIVAALASFVPWVVVLVFEGLAAVFYLAGGVNLAVLISKSAVCQGQLCTYVKADTAFLFLGLITSLIMIGICFMSRRSSGGGLHSTV